MDSNLILIVVGTSLLFAAVLGYKLLWFIRKMNEEPPAEDGKHPEKIE